MKQKNVFNGSGNSINQVKGAINGISSVVNRGKIVQNNFYKVQEEKVVERSLFQHKFTFKSNSKNLMLIGLLSFILLLVRGGIQLIYFRSISSFISDYEIIFYVDRMIFLAMVVLMPLLPIGLSLFKWGMVSLGKLITISEDEKLGLITLNVHL